MVNHSLHFVDPYTGVHTNNIESTWKTCKMKIKQMCGNSVQLISLIFGYFISLFPIKGVDRRYVQEYLDESDMYTCPSIGVLTSRSRVRVPPCTFYYRI